MIFEATDTAINYDDKAKRFQVTGFLATCRMEARVEVPSIGFHLEKRPDRQMSTSRVCSDGRRGERKIL